MPTGGSAAVGGDVWNARAAAAESAVLARFVRRIGPVAWGRSMWPPSPGGRRRGPTWHYWWSAHLIEAALDAAEHRPGAPAGELVRPLLRGVPLRNGGWRRRFWDDEAWMGIALARAGRRAHSERIARRLESAVDPEVGAIPWRIGSRLFNAPANGPAAILLARTGHAPTAERLVAWLGEHLVVPASGLVRDGLIVDDEGRRSVDDLYTYCQGVVIGAALELPGDRGLPLAEEVVGAVARWTAPDHVLPGSGGGDGGLFAGIACRYLARAARRLEGDPAALARRIVLASAEAAWEGAAVLADGPLFSAEWSRPADLAVEADHDLSVQVGAWLALEAAVEIA